MSTVTNIKGMACRVRYTVLQECSLIPFHLMLRISLMLMSPMAKTRKEKKEK
jgi:hypothetical protein